MALRLNLSVEYTHIMVIKVELILRADSADLAFFRE